MKVCAFTIARNEPFFLPVWVRYYASQFGEENVYVLDNSSDDGSIERVAERYPNVTIVPTPNDLAFDHNWLRKTVENKQRELLNTHDVVVFAESDEYLIPTSGSLREYCEKFGASNDTRVCATGYQPVHDVSVEPALLVTDSRDILAQRKKMYRLLGYDKCLITKTPVQYVAGFHSVLGAKKPRVDPGLHLVHAWMVDYDTYVSRRQARKSMQIAKGNNPHGHDDPALVEQLFKTGKLPWTGNEVFDAASPQTIPDSWRNLLFMSDANLGCGCGSLGSDVCSSCSR